MNKICFSVPSPYSEDETGIYRYRIFKEKLMEVFLLKKYGKQLETKESLSVYSLWENIDHENKSIGSVEFYDTCDYYSAEYISRQFEISSKDFTLMAIYKDMLMNDVDVRAENIRGNIEEFIDLLYSDDDVRNSDYIDILENMCRIAPQFKELKGNEMLCNDSVFGTYYNGFVHNILFPDENKISEKLIEALVKNGYGDSIFYANPDSPVFLTQIKSREVYFYQKYRNKMNSNDRESMDFLLNIIKNPYESGNAECLYVDDDDDEMWYMLIELRGYEKLPSYYATCVEVLMDSLPVFREKYLGIKEMAA